MPPNLIRAIGLEAIAKAAQSAGRKLVVDLKPGHSYEVHAQVKLRVTKGNRSWDLAESVSAVVDLAPSRPTFSLPSLRRFWAAFRRIKSPRAATLTLNHLAAFDWKSLSDEDVTHAGLDLERFREPSWPAKPCSVRVKGRFEPLEE